ncbi:MAG: peptidylprolyl isomerase [Candidatus Omnitrophica bacterium]|nr:peptidylprolyl isomerase [Candidatus Omnitrophota bacterium]
MQNKIIFKFLSVLCLFFAVCHSYAMAASLVDKITAVVNEDVITESELQESMLPFIADYRLRYGEEGLKEKMDEARQDALNRLIEEKLISQEAVKRGVTVEDNEIQQRVDDVKKRFGSDEEFYRAINSSGITLARLKKKYEEQIMMRKLVNDVIGSRVNITPSQVTAYYYGNIKDFTVPDTVRFKVILIKPTDEMPLPQARKLAEDIWMKINKGDDFDPLAARFSQGPNAQRGGDMGYMAAGSTISEIEQALSGLVPGQVSGVIETTSGFYIIKMIDKKQASTSPITEVTDTIKERLFQRESELTLREFVGKLKEDAYIKIN